jgi:hypothetical protein
MAGYVKIWTDLLHDSWVQGLSLNEKGMWFLLILLAKEGGDSGQFSVPSWRALGSVCGCDRTTSMRILRNFHDLGRLLLRENVNGTLEITLTKYHYYQRVKRPGRKEAAEENTSQIPQKGSAQSRADQSRPDQREIRSDQTRPEQSRSEQTRQPGCGVSDPGQVTGVVVEPTEVGRDLILTSFSKKFKTDLTDDDLKTLLNGKAGFEGFKSSASLLCALSLIRIKDPGNISNPMGMLIDFHKNPEKYLSDFELGIWESQYKQALKNLALHAQGELKPFT